MNNKPDKLFTAGEAAKILDMSPGGARNILGEDYEFVKIPNGHKCRAWRESHILRLKKEREAQGKKSRLRQSSTHVKHGMPFDKAEYNPGKSFEFDIDMKTGLRIPPRYTFRGRKCRHEGCDTPVPTGKIFCDVHSDDFIALRKMVATHVDEYSCKVVK